MIKIIFISLVCSSLALFTPTSASAKLMTVQDVTQSEGNLSEEIIKGIDNPEVQKKLADYGISPTEARERVAALSNQEIMDMMKSKTSLQAGGDALIGVTTVLLIVIIVLLLR